ncbi:hypothetical protein [Adhaeribacter swui]
MPLGTVKTRTRKVLLVLKALL